MKNQLLSPAQQFQKIIEECLKRTTDESTKADLNLAGEEVTKLLASFNAGEGDNSGDDKALASAVQLLSASQSVNDTLSKEIDKLIAANKSAKDGIPAEVQTAINAAVEKGDLIKKDDLPAKIEAALNAAKTAWQAELKAISDRRVALNSEKLPVPADAKLAAKEEDYTVALNSAKERATKLAPYKMDDAQRVTLCWEASTESFDVTIKILEANKPATGTNGFAGGTPAASEKKPANLSKMLC